MVWRLSLKKPFDFGFFKLAAWSSALLGIKKKLKHGFQTSATNKNYKSSVLLEGVNKKHVAPNNDHWHLLQTYCLSTSWDSIVAKRQKGRGPHNRRSIERNEPSNKIVQDVYIAISFQFLSRHSHPARETLSTQILQMFANIQQGFLLDLNLLLPGAPIIPRLFGLTNNQRCLWQHPRDNLGVGSKLQLDKVKV